MDWFWLIPLVPAFGAALNGLVGIRAFGRHVSSGVACLAMLAAFALALWGFVDLLAAPVADRVFDVRLASWITPIAGLVGTGTGAFAVDWALRLDPLSSVMTLVVSGIGLLIHIYASAYMHDEPRGSYARFFAYLNLFCFFMLLLVLGSNFLVMFVGWEGVGLCSYLLIGFWYEKKSAADAGKKAFIVNRIGDWGFLLGVFLVFATFGTLDFRGVAEQVARWPVESVQFGTVSIIALLLFVGATGKSAQIPLFVWLPDAMEGPTPVSALIHAATMVTAGVYMVARNAVLFSHAPMVLEVVAVVGVLTALVAATIGLVQTDIKRVLAYSTVSQLGYMFTAAGLGAFGAAVFHLVTHAFFKALLFLGSGSVIHGLGGEQDMRKMGGLRKFLPVTYVTMVVGALAIAGVPPLSGFFSKDEILLAAFLQNRAIWVIALATALMTAFYMFRLIAMTFLGTWTAPEAPHAGHHDAHGADPHGHDHHEPHESPATMTGPLMALAVGAIVVGFVGVPEVLGGRGAFQEFLAPSFAAPAVAGAAEHEAAATEHDAAAVGFDGEGAAAGHVTTAAAAGHASPHLSVVSELGLMGVSVAAGVFGLWLALTLYTRRQDVPARLAARLSGVYRVLLNKYYVDEAYDATFVAGTLASARGLWRFDRVVVDGFVNGWQRVTMFMAWLSQLSDRYVVDALVNLTAAVAHRLSFTFRRAQTGLIQNYALLMLVGVFTFVSLYLIARRG